MNGTTPPKTNLSNATIIGTLAFLASCAMFVYLAYVGVSRTGLVVPVWLGWVTALISMRSIVDREKHTALYIAFGVLALMVTFLHETYGYTGNVRNIPLIIGYTGIVICILDVLGLSNRDLGTAITPFLSRHLEKKEMSGRTVTRALIIVAAMGGYVLGIWLFGFLAFSPVFVVLWMLAGGKTVKNVLYGGLVTLVFIYLVFEISFKFELFRGILFIWLLDELT